PTNTNFSEVGSNLAAFIRVRLSWWIHRYATDPKTCNSLPRSMMSFSCGNSVLNGDDSFRAECGDKLYRKVAIFTANGQNWSGMQLSCIKQRVLLTKVPMIRSAEPFCW